MNAPVPTLGRLPKLGGPYSDIRVSTYFRNSSGGILLYAEGGARGEVWLETGSNVTLDPRTEAARLNWMG